MSNNGNNCSISSTKNTMSAPSQTDELPVYKSDMDPSDKETVMLEYGQILRNKIETGRGFALVQGSTGTGKSTTVPLSWLKINLRNMVKAKTKIYIALPTRVSCQLMYNHYIEIGTEIGIPPGYFGLQYHAHAVNVASAYLVIGTAGWLASRLATHPDDISRYDTIILDEVHQLDRDLELLIGVIKALQTVQDLRPLLGQFFSNILLISATMDAEVFFNHFRPLSFFLERGLCMDDILSFRDVCAIIREGMNTDFRVERYFLDEIPECYKINNLVAINEILTPVGEAPRPPKLYNSVIRVMLEIIARVVEQYRYGRGIILVILPGSPEIKRFTEYYDATSGYPGSSVCPYILELFPIHGQMSMEAIASQIQQATECDTQTPVILSTPVCDSSVTLPLLSCVIDAVLIKQLELDLDTGIEGLHKMWADLKIQTQREGRVGRLSDGISFKMIPRKFLNRISEIAPELTRTLLDELLLRVMDMSTKQLGRKLDGFVTRFFKEFLLTKPPESHIDLSIHNILNSGVGTEKRIYGPDTPEYDRYSISSMGRLMSSFQFPVATTRMGIIMSLLGDFENASFLAAVEIEGGKSLYKLGKENLKVMYMKMKYSNLVPSDDLATITLIRQWLKSTCTYREDGKQKNYQQTVQLVPVRVSFQPNNLPSASFNHCHSYYLQKIDDNVHIVKQMYKTNGFGTRSMTRYSEAVGDDAKRNAVIEERNHTLFAIMYTSPLNHVFFSVPNPNTFCSKINKHTDMLNSLYFYPPPPKDCSILEWGPQLMAFVSIYYNIWPDVTLDLLNNRVQCVFPPSSQNPHMGLVNKGVKEGLYRRMHRGKNLDFSIYFTSTDSFPDQKLPASYTTTSFNQELLTDIPWFTYCPPEQPVYGLNKRTQVVITHFMAPFSFGIRFNKKNPKFDVIINTMDEWYRTGKLVKLTKWQVHIGQHVLYVNPSYKGDTNYWNQKVMRGVVDASWEENNFGSIPAGSVNEILKVRVKLIDLGTIVDMELDDLYYYHQNDCNYGNASLFHLPQLGYTCSFNNLQPDFTQQWYWHPNSASRMSELLHNDFVKQEVVDERGQKKMVKIKYGFKRVVTLDVHWSSEFRRRIVVTDIHPIETSCTHHSFVQIVLAEGYAKPLEGTWVDDYNPQKKDGLVCPRPFSSKIMNIYKTRNMTMEKRWEDRDITGDETISCHIFTRMESALEVKYQTLLRRDEHLPLVIHKDSINCNPVDPRLANVNIGLDTYDPLVCVGSNFRTVNWDFGTKKSKALLTSTISVLNGTPGILSLITMITYPVVEIFVFDDAPRVPVGIRYYTKGLNGIKVEGEMALKVKFTGRDLILIEKLRTVLSTIHEDTRTPVNYEEFSNDLYTVFGKWRDRSDYQLPPILPPPTTVDLRNTYMRLTMPYCVLTRVQEN